MIFISLVKLRHKPTKEIMAESIKLVEKEKKEGIKYLGVYWTLGRYDMVAIIEAKDEKTALKIAGRREWAKSETLVAVHEISTITLEEAMKLVE